MGPHMKTTVEIRDALYYQARRLAAKEGVPFRAVLEAALQGHLQRSKAVAKKPFKLRRKPFHGQGLQPGIREGDWDQIRDLIYPVRKP